MAAEDKQVAYKEMIVNFIQRYFYMICFGQYALQNGFIGYPESFASWLKNSKDDLHGMIENGKVLIHLTQLQKYPQSGIFRTNLSGAEVLMPPSWTS